MGLGGGTVGSSAVLPGDLFPDLGPAGPPSRAQRPEKKLLPKPRQELLPLGKHQRGRFENSEPTIEEGEDLDIPTFRRRGIKIS